jgi:nicotinate phosphoribosyltransferase
MVYKLVEVDGHTVAKRSRGKGMTGGTKQAVRTYRSSGGAVEELVFPFGAEAPDTGHLSSTQLTVPLMRDGVAVDGLPSLEESRAYLADQLLTLPWEGLALSRDEPAIGTRFVGFPE